VGLRPCIGLVLDPLKSCLDFCLIVGFGHTHSMMNSVLRGLAGVGLVIALLAVSGCGQKGPLVPAPQAYNSR
jgi:hypothetical protein